MNVVNPDGSYGYTQTNGANGWEGNTSLLGNIYATQMELGRKDAYNRLSASAYGDIRFFKGLNYHLIGSYTFTGTDPYTGEAKLYVAIDPNAYIVDIDKNRKYWPQGQLQLDKKRVGKKYLSQVSA